MLKHISLFVAVVLLSGCGITYQPTIPPEYNGPRATIIDTYNRTGGGSAHFFVMNSLNANRNIDALNLSAGRGQGNSLTLVGMHREVPAQTLKISLVGLSYYAAPIAGIFASDGDFSIRGEIELAAQPNQTYLITGDINKTTSAVWVEDMYGNVVSDKLTINNESEVTKLIKLASQEQKTKIESLSPEVFFRNIKQGEPVDFVESKLGKADKTKLEESSFFSTEPDYVIHSYEGVGKIYYSEHKGQPRYVLKKTKKYEL